MLMVDIFIVCVIVRIPCHAAGMFGLMVNWHLKVFSPHPPIVPILLFLGLVGPSCMRPHKLTSASIDFGIISH